MTTNTRPIHSGFETLQIAGLYARTTEGRHHFGSVTNEQLTAAGFARRGTLTRPTSVFADFRER